MAETPLQKWEHCEASSSYVGAPLEPAIYLGSDENGWHMVLYPKKGAYYAHTVRRVAPRKVTDLRVREYPA
jgi:hypothetical protein